MSTGTDLRSSRWDLLRDTQRDAVAEAILAIIADGHSAPAVADIAAAAGMSRPTFYKYFPTLGAAILHAHRRALTAIAAHVDAAPSTGSGLDRFVRHLEQQFEYTRQHPELIRFFSYLDFTFRRFGLTDSERDELDAIARAAGVRLVQHFDAGRHDGSIDPALPREQTIMAVTGSVAGLEQRLLIQDEYSTGVDDRALEAHALLLDMWRERLRPTVA